VVLGRREPERGMTLVELMVTMVIASIVAASTFMFFAGQQRVYETQTKLLNVQQVHGRHGGPQPVRPIRGFWDVWLRAAGGGNRSFSSPQSLPRRRPGRQ